MNTKTLKAVNVEDFGVDVNSDYVGNVHLAGKFMLNIPANQLIELMLHIFTSVTDEQRLDLMAKCCKECGKLDDNEYGKCQCWNDE